MKYKRNISNFQVQVFNLSWIPEFNRICSKYSLGDLILKSRQRSKKLLWVVPETLLVLIPTAHHVI